MKKNKLTALVTGGTGYLGSNLVIKLALEGWKVHLVIRPGSNISPLRAVLPLIHLHEYDGTYTSLNRLMGISKPDIVFHLASVFVVAHTPEDIAKLMDCNLVFSTQLVEAMVSNKVKLMINAGTSWQYYQNKTYNPVNLYASTKQAYEDILKYYISAYGINVTTLVLFDTYGPNDPRNKVINLFYKALKNGDTLSLSPGEQLIDIVHVDDVIAAFIIAAEQISNQIVGHISYGISSGLPITLKKLSEIIKESTNKELLINWGERPYRAREVMTPWKNYKKLPGWEPKVTILNGLSSIFSRKS